MRFFNRITLQTPESVELEFTLAGIGNRALALLVDYLIWGAALFVLLIGWGILSVQLVNNKQLSLWLSAISILIVFTVYVGYFVVFESLWQGQTPGKRYAKIRVVREDGRPVGLQQATLRALVRPIDDSLFIGALLIMFGRQEKRLGDWLAGTLVVQDERSVAAANFPISSQAQELADRLLESAELAELLPDDFAVIREYLQRRPHMDREAKNEVGRQLARQVKAAIALEKLPLPATADVFLEAVYLAYQQQSSRGL